MSNIRFDFGNMLGAIANSVAQVETHLQQIQAGGGSVNVGTMFNMQFRMQMLSQLTEAMSSTLTAVHGMMISMAKAIKGS